MATARFIVKIGDPVLRSRAQEVEEFGDSLRQLVEDMWETMRVAHGTGLAAPQIGLPIRVLVAKHQDREVTLVNPEITNASEEQLLGAEGCLSIPGFTGLNISRAASVTVKARDIQGNKIVIEADEWFARVLQHEIDHLNGTLYIDRLTSPEDLRITIPEEIGIALDALAASQSEHAAPTETGKESASAKSGQTRKGTRGPRGSRSDTGSGEKRTARKQQGHRNAKAQVGQSTHEVEPAVAHPRKSRTAVATTQARG